MAKEYLFNKEKDKRLQKLFDKFCLLETDEKRIEFIRSIPVETRHEVLSYSRWKNAEMRVQIEKTLEKRKKLEAKNEKIRSKIEESKSIEKAFDLIRIFGLNRES